MLTHALLTIHNVNLYWTVMSIIYLLIGIATSQLVTYVNGIQIGKQTGV